MQSKRQSTREFDRLVWELDSAQNQAKIGFIGFLAQLLLMGLTLATAGSTTPSLWPATVPLIVAIFFWYVWFRASNRFKEHVTALINRGEQPELLLSRSSAIHHKLAPLVAIVVLIQMISIWLLKFLGY